jgi:hypothetical protein
MMAHDHPKRRAEDAIRDHMAQLALQTGVASLPFPQRSELRTLTERVAKRHSIAFDRKAMTKKAQAKLAE